MATRTPGVIVRAKTKLNHLSYARRTELFNSCVNQAYHAAERYRRMGRTDYENIKQAALMGLWDAALTFDTMLGFKFTTYAQWKIRGAISYEYERIMKVFRRETTTITADNDDEDRAIEVPFFDNGQSRFEESELIADLFRWLTPKQKEILSLRFWGNWSYVQIAAKYGVTKERVRQIIEEALEYCRYKCGATEDEPTTRPDSQNSGDAGDHSEGVPRRCSSRDRKRKRYQTV
jgi:RNA polymerase sigma factor (sigma-70 family)